MKSDYLSVKQVAEKWKISPRRVQIMCKESRVSGAQIVGNCWIIPADAKKPEDARIKSGRYIKLDK